VLGSQLGSHCRKFGARGWGSVVLVREGGATFCKAPMIFFCKAPMVLFHKKFVFLEMQVREGGGGGMFSLSHSQG